MRYLVAGFVTVLAIAAPGVQSVQTDINVTTRHHDRLHGTMHYQHGTWDVRLDLQPIDEGHVLLTLPELGMAGIEIDAERNGDSITAIFPYGIGEQTLLKSNDVWSTTTAQQIDPDELTIILGTDPAQRPTLTTVTFQNGTIALEGTLWTPTDTSAAPYPLIVAGHGAARYTRDMPEYRYWGEHFTRLGFAVFLYDKRGLGQSQGVYENAAINDLTADYIAAVQAASRQEQVDPQRVVLFGGSQFGWTAFRAARQLDIRAMVLKAPPAVDPVTLEVRVLADDLRAAGIKGDDLADALAFVRLYFAAARHPELFDELIALADNAAHTTWIEHVPVPSQHSDMAWWGEHATLDPTDDILACDVPVFIAFGRDDPLVTPEINAVRFETLLARAGCPLELWIADEADHRIEVPARMVNGVFRFPQYAPGLLDRIDAFVLEHSTVSTDALR